MPPLFSTTALPGAEKEEAIGAAAAIKADQDRMPLEKRKKEDLGQKKKKKKKKKKTRRKCVASRFLIYWEKPEKRNEKNTTTTTTTVSQLQPQRSGASRKEFRI